MYENARLRVVLVLHILYHDIKQTLKLQNELYTSPYKSKRISTTLMNIMTLS